MDRAVVKHAALIAGAIVGVAAVLAVYRSGAAARATLGRWADSVGLAAQTTFNPASSQNLIFSPIEAMQAENAGATPGVYSIGSELYNEGLAFDNPLKNFFTDALVTMPGIYEFRRAAGWLPSQQGETAPAPPFASDQTGVFFP